MDAVASALARAADTGLLPRGGAILLAVSGGPDSMALLDGTARLAAETGWILSVGHVHHGWRRREADRDLAFVSDWAGRLGLPFFARRLDASRVAKKLGLSPEAGARHARYAALHGIARDAGAERIATAHQRDDVAETHLLARDRRGGLASLAGPRERRADGIVRPLLSVTRSEILAVLAARGIASRRDATNGSLRFPRTRARRAIAESEDPASTVARLGADADALARERDRVEKEVLGAETARWALGPGASVADADWLAGCPREVARAALERAAMPYAGLGRAPMTGPERERILDLLASGSDFRFEAGRRIRFERRERLLSVSPRPTARARVDSGARRA